jgi:hypothetical protein
VQQVGVLVVVLGQRAHAIVREELGFVQHAGQDALEAVAAHQRQQAAVAGAGLLPA